MCCPPSSSFHGKAVSLVETPATLNWSWHVILLRLQPRRCAHGCFVPAAFTFWKINVQIYFQLKSIWNNQRASPESLSAKGFPRLSPSHPCAPPRPPHPHCLQPGIAPWLSTQPTSSINRMWDITSYLHLKKHQLNRGGKKARRWNSISYKANWFPSSSRLGSSTAYNSFAQIPGWQMRLNLTQSHNLVLRSQPLHGRHDLFFFTWEVI